MLFLVQGSLGPKSCQYPLVSTLSLLLLLRRTGVLFFAGLLVKAQAKHTQISIGSLWTVGVFCCTMGAMFQARGGAKMEIQGWAAMGQGEPLKPHRYILEPEKHECLVKVLACGICHSDLHMIDDDWKRARYPLVPGHEVVGEVVEVGSHVSHLKPGTRVGIGWQRSACLHCRDCLAGDENLCDDNQGLITDGAGGFADHLVVDANFAFPLPDGVETSHAGPLLCAGVTVYSALRQAGMTSGQRVGVIGVGGLGHLAVQFASRLGNHVTVFTSSDDKAEFAHKLGAHDAVLVPRDEKPAAPSRPLDIILNTVAQPLPFNSYLRFLGTDGTLVFVAAPAKTSLVLPFLMNKRRRIMGSLIGGRATMLDMLQQADLHGIQPTIETFPFSRINDAIQKVRDNTIRYRAVLTHADG